MKTVISTAILLFLFASNSQTEAQTANFPQQIDPGINLQQQEKIKQQKELQEKPITNLKEQFEKEEQETKPEAKPQCIQIKEINLALNGLKPLSENKIILNKYTGTCLSISDIKDLLNDLKKNYTDAGYFQIQTILKEQDLSTGILGLTLLPTRLEAITLKPEEPQHPQNIFRNSLKGLQDFRFNNSIRSSFPVKKQKILKFADLETGIDSLNSLDSIDARLLVSPGKEEGKTVLYLDIKENDRFRGFMGFNNQGQDFLGKYKLNPSLEIDNLLQMGDTWTASYFGNINTDAIVLNTRIPLKPKWTFSGSYIYSDFSTGLNTGTSSDIIDLYGDFKMWDASLTRQLYRKNAVQIYGSVGGAVKKSHRELGGFALTDQNESVLYSNLYGLVRKKTWQANLGMGIYGGIPVFNATIGDKHNKNDIPDGRFVKFEGFGNYYKKTKLGLFHNSFSGQFIPTAAYGLEHIVLGGMYSVRGYPESVSSAEQGFLNRNEFEAEIPLPKTNKIFKTIRESIHPIVFADQGLARYAYNKEKQEEYLVSMGAGFRITHKLINLELSYGFPFIKPNYSQDFTSGGRIHFNFRIKGF